MLTRILGALSLLGVVSWAAEPALADPVFVPNASFESPVVANVSPYATPDIANWQKAPVPAWWLGSGYTADQWNNSAGTFLNVPFAPLDNVDGNQVAFLFATPDLGLSQDLSATYQPGKAYRLAVGIEGGGYGMLAGVPIDIQLYYRDAGNNPVTIGSATFTNNNTTGVLSHLWDVNLNLSTVQAGDAWAGKNIGVQIVSASDFTNSGGYWDVDNVRLNTVPEPASLTLLGIGAAVLGWRRRRNRK